MKKTLLAILVLVSLRGIGQTKAPTKKVEPPKVVQKDTITIDENKTAAIKLKGNKFIVGGPYIQGDLNTFGILLKALDNSNESHSTVKALQDWIIAQLKSEQ